MPIGEHLSRCRKCGKSFICGDCIAFECGDCRRKRWDAEQAKRGSEQRMVGGIVIPDRAPIGIREALRNFVEAVEAYGETGVWPDNYTFRRLADDGREALGPRNSANSALRHLSAY